MELKVLMINHIKLEVTSQVEVAELWQLKDGFKKRCTEKSPWKATTKQIAFQNVIPTVYQ